MNGNSVRETQSLWMKITKIVSHKCCHDFHSLILGLRGCVTKVIRHFHKPFNQSQHSFHFESCAAIGWKAYENVMSLLCSKDPHRARSNMKIWLFSIVMKWQSEECVSITAKNTILIRTGLCFESGHNIVLYFVKNFLCVLSKFFFLRCWRDTFTIPYLTVQYGKKLMWVVNGEYMIVIYD